VGLESLEGDEAPGAGEKKAWRSVRLLGWAWRPFELNDVGFLEWQSPR